MNQTPTINNGTLIRTAFLQEIFDELGDDWAATSDLDDLGHTTERFWDAYQGAMAFKTFDDVKKCINEEAVNVTNIKPGTPGIVVGCRKYKGQFFYRVLFKKYFWLKSDEIIEIKKDVQKSLKGCNLK